MGRSCGVLLPVASLPSRATMTRGGVTFPDSFPRQSPAASRPSPTDPAQGHSPYSGPSAFAGNGTFHQPGTPCRGGPSPSSDLSHSPGRRVRTRPRRRFCKRALFKKVLGEVRPHPLREGVPASCGDNAFRLEDYALFSSLKRSLGLPRPAEARAARTGTGRSPRRRRGAWPDEIEREVFLQLLPPGSASTALAFRERGRPGDRRRAGLRQPRQRRPWVTGRFLDLDAGAPPPGWPGVPLDYFSRSGSGGATPSTAGTPGSGKVSTGGSKRLRHGWPCSTGP